MTHNKEARGQLGRLEFNSFRRSVLTIGMEFSDSYNSVYGVSSATALLATMCREGMCAEQASEILNASGAASPGSDWLLGKLGHVEYDDMHARAGRALRRTAKDALGGGMIMRHPLVAIDKTRIERYDKDPDMTHLIKTKGRGTSTAEAYMTARTVGTNLQFHLACIPVTRHEFNPYFVRRTLDEVRQLHVRPRLLLMDREFYAVDVMRTISRACLRFLMPAVCTAGIRKAMREFEDGGRGPVSGYVLRAQNGDEFRCTLAIVPRADPSDGDRHIGFVTNTGGCTPEDLMSLPEEYRKRWGIETGYRDAKRVMPHTTSRKDAVRLVLFFLSLIVSNIWMYARAKSKRVVKLAVLLTCMIRHAVSVVVWKPPDTA